MTESRIERIETDHGLMWVFRDATAAQLLNLLKAKHWWPCRGFIADRQYFVWNAYDAVHDEVEQALGFEHKQVAAEFLVQRTPPTISITNSHLPIGELIAILRPLLRNDLVRVSHLMFTGTLSQYEKTVMLDEQRRETTMTKFWINAKTGQFEPVDDEHYNELPIEFSGPMDAVLSHGWVRGGMSDYTDKLHLEAATLPMLRKAIPYLLNRYAPTGIEIDYHVQGVLKSADLDMEQVSIFLRHGRIPRRR